MKKIGLTKEQVEKILIEKGTENGTFTGDDILSLIAIAIEENNKAIAKELTGVVSGDLVKGLKKLGR
ncbi:hypothetical protein [Bacillus cereus]|uniref:hypothetical protein n=1 Tax=Bacillus cereus TaxID=1396 RepID=UPI0038203A5F